MGQRLVVTIEKNKQPLAKLYFHWSGYTGDALYVTRDIVHCIYNHDDETEKELQLRLVRFCEERGGCIDGGPDGEEWMYVTQLYPNEQFKPTGDRSNGLIALSKSGMVNMQRHSEADVYIELDDDTVDFCVYSGYDSLEEYIEERKSWDDDFEEFVLEEIQDLGYSLGYFDVKDIDDLIEAFENIEDNQNVIRCGNEIVELI
jgi:hypothetical protein